MGDITPPPSGTINTTDLIIFIVASLAILLAFILLVGFTTYFIIKKQDKRKQLLTIKKEPIAFTNKSNNDITIIATDNYAVIEIQFTLYDKNNNIIKKYVVSELNFTINEQRVIANTKDFNAHKIGYSIINYK